MRFAFDFTVPADTSFNAPERLDVKLVRGTLVHVEVGFPPGPADKVSVVIVDHSFQILPVNPEAPLHWDDRIFLVNMRYKLVEHSHPLTLYGWSPGTIFPHTINFQFDVDPAGAGDERSIIEQLFAGVALPGRS